MSALLPLLKESICIPPCAGLAAAAQGLTDRAPAWGLGHSVALVASLSPAGEPPASRPPGPWHIPLFQRGLFNGSPRNNNSLCHQERRKGVKCLDGIRGKPRRDDLGAVIIHLIGAWGKLLDREMELKRLERAPGRLCGRAGFISNI